MKFLHITWFTLKLDTPVMVSRVSQDSPWLYPLFYKELLQTPRKQKWGYCKPSLSFPRSPHLIDSPVPFLFPASFKLLLSFTKQNNLKAALYFLLLNSAWATSGSPGKIRAEEMSSLLRTIKGSEILPYLEAHKLSWCSFMDIGRSHEIPGSETKDSLLLTGISEAISYQWFFGLLVLS